MFFYSFFHSFYSRIPKYVVKRNADFLTTGPTGVYNIKKNSLRNVQEITSVAERNFYAAPF